MQCMSALKGNHTPDPPSTLKTILVSPTYTVLKGKLLIDTPLLTESWKATYP